jgi:ABC-type dipeptide/oligopeptide/nickel transport system permease component
MVNYIFRRFIILLILLFLVTSFVFLLIHLVPGDPASIIAGVGASQEAIESIRQELGLNRPLVVQYFDKIKGLFVGDMGKSLMTGTPVNELVWERFGATLELVTFGAVFSIVLGIPLGMIAARNYNKFFDHLITTIATLFISIPVFVVGTFLIYFFAMNWNILPSGGFVEVSKSFVDHSLRIIMPGITLGLGLTTVNVRMMRSSLIEIMDKNFMCASSAKGLTQNRVFWVHGVRNALIPVITVFGVQLGYLFGGSVIVEHIFNWPGLSTLLVNAVFRRDYPVIEGAMIIITYTYFIINLIVDLLYVVIDPRVSYE